MAACVVLGDSAIHELLINFTKADILNFQDKLKESLRQWSGPEERKYQPGPSVVVRPNGQRNLFRPFTSPENVGVKIIVDPAPEKSANGGTEKKHPLHGVLVVCDKNGIPTGILNAEEITAFRTSLSAILLYTGRSQTDNILVFGAGKQALWHVRLALALRGDEIKNITLVNRSEERAREVIAKLKEDNSSRWKSTANFATLAASEEEKVRAKLAEADAIFCTVPSQAILFSEKDIPAGRQPYISAIGSWQPNMIELDPALLKRVVAEGQFNPNGGSGSVVIVDDRKSCSEDTGEILQSGLTHDQMIELGEVLDIKEQKDKLAGWLQDGFVVYKSVGVGLTDLVAGQAMLELAREKKLGQIVSDL